MARGRAVTPRRPTEGASAAVTTPQIVTVNPASGQHLAAYDAFGAGQIEASVAAAYSAQAAWAGLTVAERAGHLRAVAATLRADRDSLAALMVAEMGKPLAEALAEVDKCAWNCESSPTSAAGWLADHEVARRAAVLAVLRAARRRLRGDALELPVLAGAPLRCGGAAAGNAGAAQALPERHRLRAGDRGAFADAGAPAASSARSSSLADERAGRHRRGSSTTRGSRRSR